MDFSKNPTVMKNQSVLQKEFLLKLLFFPADIGRASPEEPAKLYTLTRWLRVSYTYTPANEEADGTTWLYLYGASAPEA